jgi:hypothetical protein
MSSHTAHLENLSPDEIGFRVHGPDAETDDFVSAAVFASKLGSLVRALKAADRAANGYAAHDYKIKRLASSSPTALLVERPLPKGMDYSSSGIEAFDTCADAVIAGEADRARKFGKCVNHLSSLAAGSEKQFGYGEVWTRDHNVIRIDAFLKERSQAVISPIKVARPDESTEWFKGVVDGSFDGTVLEVDLRGALPEIKLVLSAGGQQIDCVCRQDHLEQIRASLKNRAQIFGRAIYDGRSGLPRRIEVSEIEIVGGGDLTAWRGAFEPFHAPDWEGDDV